MPKYIPYNYDQHSMVVINYKEQLQPGTFEHAIHFLIKNKLDLSIFHPRCKNEQCDDERIERTEQTINTLDKAYEKIDQFLKSHPATHS